MGCLLATSVIPTRLFDQAADHPISCNTSVDDGKSLQGERNGALLRADGVVRLKKCLTGETLLEMAYYHEDRIHIGLEKTTPARRPVEARPNEARNVVALPRIGGLHHRYTWSQAA